MYPVSEQMEARLANDFTYHPPKPGQQERYIALRESAKAFARQVVELTPPGREQSLALTSIEQAVMNANAAIARGEK
ncbi:MAG: hypothetical protein ACH37Z_12270 [Anaerolineae bacterium]